MSFIRELGAAERIYCREQTDYGNQTLVQVLLLSDKIRIDEVQARQALIQLQKNYAQVLGYEICRSNDGTTLVYRSKHIERTYHDLMSSFRFKKGVDWRQIFENELNLPFDNHNLSRWILIDGNILIISIHHAAVDAKNLFYISQKFISLCLSNVQDSPIFDYLEPMEQYLFGKYTFEPISDLEMKPRPSRPDPIESRTKLRYCSIDKIILNVIKKKCHEHKIRMNSILTVITAIAYHLASDETKEKKLKVHMMVNIRPQLDLDFQSTGVFVTVFDCFIDIDEDPLLNIWENAIKQHEDLHRRIENKEYITNCKNDSDLLAMINNDEIFSCDDVHFAFSNLGLLTNETLFNEQYFGVSLIEQRWTSSILVGISSINDRLCFSITYNENKISSLFVDKWIEKVYFLLEKI